ncbi:RNA-binding domain-containing protein [Cupriavidus plantarum]|nr:hypothetical protein LMG26296_03614 [Cupriavidus plantarum]SMR85981.1 Putative DNA-binding domain-containing protein [Cupriavidus plantarum]
MEEGSQVEVAELSVTRDADDRVTVSKTTGPLILEALSAMSDPEGQKLIVRLGQWDPYGLRIEDVEGAIPRQIVDGLVWMRIRASGVFHNRGGSTGEVAVMELSRQVAARRRARVKLPMLVDDWDRWPQDLNSVMIKLLQACAQDSQVIVFAADAGRAGQQLISLDGRTNVASDALAQYDYRYESRRPNLKPQKRAAWVLGSTFSRQENRTCEFKEVKGSNPLGSIKGVVDQYAVAFLNAGDIQEGAIFWGIRDEDREVVGVRLTVRECDELRRVVTERLFQIVPPIAPTAYRIEIHPINDGRFKVIEDLYIVEVRVPAMRRTLLFATGGQEVYVKTDAGKKKLSTLELQQELVRRLGISPEI